MNKKTSDDDFGASGDDLVMLFMTDNLVMILMTHTLVMMFMMQTYWKCCPLTLASASLSATIKDVDGIPLQQSVRK